MPEPEKVLQYFNPPTLCYYLCYKTVASWSRIPHHHAPYKSHTNDKNKILPEMAAAAAAALHF
jgi:hypothetical protein